MYVGYVVVTALMDGRKTLPESPAQPAPAPRRWHEIPGVAPDASGEGIRSAFQAKSDEINAGYNEAVRANGPV